MKKGAKKAGAVVAGAASGAKDAMAMYKKGVSMSEKGVKDADTEDMPIVDREKDAMDKDGMAMYKKGPAKYEAKDTKYDMTEAYNKDLTADARLHYLENARHNKDSKTNPMSRSGMKGGTGMYSTKISYGNQASGRNMSNYARGNGRPGTLRSGGSSMSKHMKGGKK